MIRQELPSHVYAERMVLGSLLLRGDRWQEFADSLSVADFSVESHRTFWRRMETLARRGDSIDMATLGAELERQGEFQQYASVLVNLTEGIPEIPNLPSYVQRVRETGLRRRIIIEAERIQQLAADQSVELADISGMLSKLAQDSTMDAVENEFSSIVDVIDACGGLGAYVERRKSDMIPFPWQRLQTATGGMRSGELIIIGGESGGGKTAFAGNIVQHAGVNGYGVAVFSLEMSRDELVNRQLALAGRFNSRWFRHCGELHTAQIERIEEACGILLDAKIWLADMPNLTVTRLIGAVNRLRMRRPVHLVVVDYLQLMEAKGASDRERITAIVRGLKNAAAELALPIVALSQYTKQSLGAERSSSDFIGSSEIKHAANLALLLKGEQTYHTSPQELLPWSVLIDKQRAGDSKVEIEFVWRKDCGWFQEVSHAS
jgi:replicative DNA helicase